MPLNFDHEGELSAGHRHTEQSLSFGLDSGRVRKSSAKYSYDIFDANGKLSVGDKKLGASLSGDVSVGHVEAGYEYDGTSFIPKLSGSAEANLIQAKSEFGVTKSGIEHKIADLQVKGPGASVSASAGGKTVLPVASGEYHTVSGSASVGYDDLRIKGGLGNGPGYSASADAKNMIPDGLKDSIKADPVPSTLGQPSAGISGVGSVSRDANGNVSFKEGVGFDTISNAEGYSNVFKGKSGNEKGTAAEVFASDHNRNNLIKDADKFHKDSSKTINGDHFWTSAKAYNNIRDDSSGFINRLNSAIDQAELQKQAADNKLDGLLAGGADPNSKECGRLSKESGGLASDIQTMTGLRDRIATDRALAGDRLSARGKGDSVSGGYDYNAGASKTTDQMTRDARENADRFQDAFTGRGKGADDPKGMGKHLSDPARDLCRSRNELDGRINHLDRRIGEVNSDLGNIAKQRQDYLDSHNMSLKQAVDNKDPMVDYYNRREEALRGYGQKYRAEKGECQKARLETDKNFMPRYESEPFEKRDRELQGQKIDNDNAKAKADDNIANYCNRNGITKDNEGNYITPDGKEDPALNSLLNERAGLDTEGKNIENLTAANKKDLAESQKDGKSDLRVSEKDGNAVVTFNRDDYGKHAEDNKDLRWKEDTSDADDDKSDGNDGSDGNPGSDDNDNSGAGGSDDSGSDGSSENEGESSGKDADSESGVESEGQTDTEYDGTEREEETTDGEEKAEKGEESDGEDNTLGSGDDGSGSDSGDGDENSSSGGDDSGDDEDGEEDEGHHEGDGESEGEDEGFLGGEGETEGEDEGFLGGEGETEGEDDGFLGGDEETEGEDDGEDDGYFGEDGDDDGEDDGEDEGEDDGEDEGFVEEPDPPVNKIIDPGDDELNGRHGSWDPEPNGKGNGGDGTGQGAEGTGQGQGNEGTGQGPDGEGQGKGDGAGKGDGGPGPDGGETGKGDGGPGKEATSEGMPDSAQGEQGVQAQSDGSSMGMPDSMQGDGVVTQEGASQQMPNQSEGASEGTAEGASKSNGASEAMPNTPEGNQEGNVQSESASAQMPTSSGPDVSGAAESAGEAASSGAEKTADAAQSAGDGAQSAGEAAGTGMGM